MNVLDVALPAILGKEGSLAELAPVLLHPDVLGLNVPDSIVTIIGLVATSQADPTFAVCMAHEALGYEIL